MAPPDFFPSFEALPKAAAARYARLHHKKYRQQQQRYIAEGLRTVTQLCRRWRSGRKPADAPEALILSAKTLEEARARPGSEAAELVQQAAETAAAGTVRLYSTGDKMMHKLSDTRQPQGVLAVMCMPDNTASENRMDKLLSGNTAREPHFLLALDGVSDPGNVGTLYRSAAWFSAAGLLLGPDCAELYNPKVVRSTAGATGSLAVVEQALPALLKTLEAAGYHIMLLDLNASARSLYEVFSAPETRPSKVVMVIGNEAHGISEPLRQRFQAVFIPGTDAGVESLNAGVSGSIAMSFFHAAHHS